MTALQRLCGMPCTLAAVALLAACSSIQRSGAAEQVEVAADLVYRPGSENPKHRLDLYLPRGKAGWPVVVFVHGGYWRGGDRSYWAFFTGLYGSVGLALARQGIGTAVISYRLAPEVQIEGAIEDVVQAARFTLEAAGARGGRPDGWFLAGHSAGGHLAALLAADPRPLAAAGLDPARLRGVIALSPVLDLVAMRDRNDAAFNADVTARAFGLQTARLQAFSPLLLFHRQQAPLLLLYGEDDYPYLLEQLPAAAARLRELGAPVEEHRLPGHSHVDLVWRIGGGADQVTPLVADFVRRHAGG